MSETRTLTEIADALSLATKITAKADALLAPLVAEMQLGGWREEFQEIMWNTIAQKAKRLAKQARTEA